MVGILDLLFAFTFSGLILGGKPLRIFQSVAAGVLGRPRAVEGGVRTFLLGILLHFVVATCIATVFYLATLVLPILIRHPIISVELRSARLFWNEVYRPATLSHRAKRDTASSTDSFDRSYRTRFAGRFAARIIGRRFANEK